MLLGGRTAAAEDCGDLALAALGGSRGEEDADGSAMSSTDSSSPLPPCVKKRTETLML